jgi:hypothetical protein
MTRGRFDQPTTADDPTDHAVGRPDLAARQAALVAALVNDGPVPDGFDRHRVSVARKALLRKRAGLLARVWPVLASECQWPDQFIEWVDGHTPQGALRDGFDFARHLHSQGPLTSAAAVELAEYEVLWHYDGHRPPRRRRLPALRRAGDTWLVHVLGRLYRWRG